MFSFNDNHHADIDNKLKDILDNSSVKEFKWKKLRDAKYRFCAEKIINFIFQHLHTYDIRIDTLIWDTQDDRHSIPNRDDTANFERMFFHLLHSALRKRPKKSKWRIYPDERLDIDWNTIEQCLSAVGIRQEHVKSPLLGDFFADQYYEISDFKQLQSHDHPCTHIADLFAGLSVFSKTRYDKYCSWKSCQNPGLFGADDTNFSKQEEARFVIMDLLNTSCKANKLGVSLKSNQCFATLSPKNPINFWHYASQHEKDRAPKKGY